VTQGYVSKLERQNDMLLSNLYAYVEALGGEVEIREIPRSRGADHAVPRTRKAQGGARANGEADEKRLIKGETGAVAPDEVRADQALDLLKSGSDLVPLDV
jgi:hypothetical protein